MSIVLTYFFTIKCAFLDLCVWSAAVESVCWVGYEINKGMRASLVGVPYSLTWFILQSFSLLLSVSCCLAGQGHDMCTGRECVLLYYSSHLM